MLLQSQQNLAPPRAEAAEAAIASITVGPPDVVDADDVSRPQTHLPHDRTPAYPSMPKFYPHLDEPEGPPIDVVVDPFRGGKGVSSTIFALIHHCVFYYKI